MAGILEPQNTQLRQGFDDGAANVLHRCDAYGYEEHIADYLMPKVGNVSCPECNKQNGFVALEVDPDTLRPVGGPILGWSHTRKEALHDYRRNIGEGVSFLGTFRWIGSPDPDGLDVWEYDHKTDIVRFV